MYPCRGEKYLLEFFYSPQNAPPHIQDKFSWNGEGFTDSNFLNTSIRKGCRVMYATLDLTRDQLLRRGEWAMVTGKTPVLQTKNYVSSVSSKGSDADIIQVPGIRAEK